MPTGLQGGASPSNEVRWLELVGLALERWAWSRGNGVLGLDLIEVLVLFLLRGLLLSWVKLKIGKGPTTSSFLVISV